jgi:hypothetical protein
MRFEHEGHEKMRSELNKRSTKIFATRRIMKPGTSSLPAFWDSQLEKLKLKKTEVVAPILVLASTYR